MNSHQYVIRRISSKETYPVRHPVLRKGRPLKSCRFEGDDLAHTIHLGLFLETDLIAVATFLKNNHSLFFEEYQYQLRGMAVLESHQGRSLGEKLLNHGEEELKKINIQRLWFNARTGASKFYKKHGYAVVGDKFEIPDVGPHYLMTKLL